MKDINSLPSHLQPDKALAAVVSLRLLADKLEQKSVIEAIKQGWTWAQVAEALGVSRQAAHKKYACLVKKINEGMKNDFSI